MRKVRLSLGGVGELVVEGMEERSETAEGRDDARCEWGASPLRKRGASVTVDAKLQLEQRMRCTSCNASQAYSQVERVLPRDDNIDPVL
jgi:hypothetical protein